MRNDTVRFLRVVGVILAVVAIGGFWLYSREGAPRNVDLAFVSRFVPFPESARLTNSEFHKGFQGGQLWARVEIERGDVETFVRSLPSVKRVSRTDRLGITRSHWSDHSPPSWWDPDSARRFAAANIDKSGVEVSILVSLDDPKNAVVWVVSVH